MIRKISLIIVIFTQLCVLPKTDAASPGGDEQIYEASVPPMVLLVMGRNHKLFYEAYNDASDLDGDLEIDVGYKPWKIDYYGYFDSHKYYQYVSNRFEPVGNTVNNDPSNPYSSAKQVPSGTTDTTYWSGDFLNYLTMSRMDCIRKVLYGGYRSTDSDTQTVLERSFIPQDAHSWGKEYKSVSDDLYDIRNYSPLSLPNAPSGSLVYRHLFASTNLSTTSDPILRVLPNNTHRIWEWVAKERPVCDASLEAAGSGGGSHPGHPNNVAEFDAIETGWTDSSQSVYHLYGNTNPTNIDGAGNPSGADYYPSYNQYADEQENYLTIFTGELVVARTGSYTFAVDGDDAVDFFIELDGNLGWSGTMAADGGDRVASWYGGHGRCSCSDHAGDSVTLAAGTYQIKFRHEEANGGDNYYLRWNGPDSGYSWQIVPANSGSGGLQNLTQTTYRLETPAVPASTITDYAVRVLVCDTTITNTDTSHFKQYPSGYYKPVGILQRYGEPGKMLFGLISGSYARNTAGGVLRKAIGSINDEIDANTGRFTSTNGIISTINKFKIVGFDYGSHSYNQNCGWITTRPINAGECRMWGNPVAEMMYEGLRYFAGKTTPTSDFTYSGTTDDSTLGLPIVTSWTDPYNSGNYCATPFMLVLSDIYPTYDSDQLPGHHSAFSGTTFSGDIAGLDVESLADTILVDEGEAGDHYVGRLGATYDGSCSPKTMDGFGDVRGLCPEEPTKQGSYYAASVAYYGRNNDISSAPGTQNLLTYAVGIASSLPRIEIPVGNAGKLITLVPFAKSVGGSSISVNQGDFQPTNTIVDFFVESVTSSYGKFRVNYEDVEQGADHDMDAIIIYEYQVVDSSGTAVADYKNGTGVKITLTSTYAAGSIMQHAGYIISGTTADGTYLEVRDSDTSAGSDPDYFLDTPPGQGPGGRWNDSVALPLTASRTFYLGTTTAATLLNNPLWYAAKWGGFRDENGVDGSGNLKPDIISEWDEDGDDVPDTYFYVVNPLKFEEQLNQSFSAILSRGVSHVAPVVSVDETNRTQSGDEVYMAFFRPMSDEPWQGNLKKYSLSYQTRTDCGRTGSEWTIVDKNSTIAGECDGSFKANSTSYWSTTNDGGYVDRGGVGSLLASAIDSVPGSGPFYDFRNIYTYKTSTPSFVRFYRDGDSDTTNDPVSAWDLFTAAEISAMAEPSLERDKVINYIYGYTYSAVSDGNTATYDAVNEGNPTSKRKWILGDVIHSEPCIIDYLNADNSLKARFIVIGGNDGMLHVFTDRAITLTFNSVTKTYSAGSEIWAFIPEDLLMELNDYATSSDHTYFIDGSVVVHRSRTFTDTNANSVRDTNEYFNKTLVFGERRGGRSYWAINVTHPDPNMWSVKWTRDNSHTDYAELGYTWSKPSFAKIRTGATTYTDVVIFSAGYDSEEDYFPEPWDDSDDDGMWDDGNSNGQFDTGDEVFTDYAGGTASYYDHYNPDKNDIGRGIYIVELENGKSLFRVTYGTTDDDIGNVQTYTDMKWCFPADPTVINLDGTLLIYAADIYSNIWKVNYIYNRAGEDWTVKRIFKSNPGSEQVNARAAIDGSRSSVVKPSLDTVAPIDYGRKSFYSPDVSYGGSEWTTHPLLFFGTGDRTHPRYLPQFPNRFYAVADVDEELDETDLLNLTCDELDTNADVDQDGDVDGDDALLKDDSSDGKVDLYDILYGRTDYPDPSDTINKCRGWYKVLGDQQLCTQDDTDHTGEMCISKATLFRGIVYFTGYQPVFGDACNPNGNAFIYALDYSFGTAALDLNVNNNTDTSVSLAAEDMLDDTYQVIENSSIPSGVRIIIREGVAAGMVSAGGSVVGAGEEESAGDGHSTEVPGPPGGAKAILWESD